MIIASAARNKKCAALTIVKQRFRAVNFIMNTTKAKVTA